MAWKLSVLEHISNLSRGYNFQTTLNGAVASGSNSLTIPSGHAAYYFKLGDIIKIGPSTDSANPGSYEFKQVLSVTATTIGLESNTTYEYGDGDPVSGIGSGLAENWTVHLDGHTLVTYGISQRQGGFHLLYSGFRNGLNSQWFSLTAGTGTGGYLEFMLNRPLLQNVTYRAGGYFTKINSSGSGAIYLQTHQSSANKVIDTSLVSAGTSWTKIEGTGTTSATVANWSANPYIRVWADVTYQFTLFGFDCIYLTHASLVPSGSGGVYSIPVDPIRVEQDFDDTEQIAEAIRNTSYSFGPLDVYTPSKYSLLFENANDTMINDLEALIRWQSMGYLLMLEPDISGKPPLIGFLDISQVHHHWDDAQIGVELSFRGV